MKVDLLKIITDAKRIYWNNRCHIGMCCAIEDAITENTYAYTSYLVEHIVAEHIKKTVHKPPKQYYPLKARHILPYDEGYWWPLYDVESRLKRFDEYIEYFKKPENRYLEV